jgi:hypothetical protein
MADEVPGEGSSFDAMIEETCQSALTFISGQLDNVTSIVLLVAFRKDENSMAFARYQKGSSIECVGLMEVAKNVEATEWKNAADEDDEEETP